MSEKCLSQGFCNVDWCCFQLGWTFQVCFWEAEVFSEIVSGKRCQVQESTCDQHLPSSSFLWFWRGMSSETCNIEVRDAQYGIFGSWARWTRAPPRFQSSWETAVAAAVAVAAPPAGRCAPAPRARGARRPPTPPQGIPTLQYGHRKPIIGYGAANYGHWGPKYAFETFKSQFWCPKTGLWALF